VALNGIRKYGFPNAIVTSNYIAAVDAGKCKGCGKCSLACGIDGIEMVAVASDGGRRKVSAPDESICLGCGVCALKCPSGALSLKRRAKRVLHPEDTFERVILQSLERGTLQNQIFDNPRGLTQRYMRGFVGGFLRLPPVKKALMSKNLRSSFLGLMKTGIKKQGKGHLLDL